MIKINIKTRKSKVAEMPTPRSTPPLTFSSLFTTVSAFVFVISKFKPKEDRPPLTSLTDWS